MGGGAKEKWSKKTKKEKGGEEKRQEQERGTRPGPEMSKEQRAGETGEREKRRRGRCDASTIATRRGHAGLKYNGGESKSAPAHTHTQRRSGITSSCCYIVVAVCQLLLITRASHINNQE